MNIFQQIGIKYPREANYLSLAFTQAHTSDEIYPILRTLTHEHHMPSGRLSGYLQGSYFQGVDWEDTDFSHVRDQAWAYREAHVPGGNPSTSRGRKRCAKGEIPIDRKGYTREGYTRQDGTRVAATKVPSATYCVPDRGRPGVTSFGAESGTRKGTKPLIQREGKLGGPGYTTKPERERHMLLGKCEKKYGYRSCLGSLQVLLNSSEMKGHARAVLAADKKWLVGKYGGPGSFGPRSNPEPGALEADELGEEVLLVVVGEFNEGVYADCMCAMGFAPELVGEGDVVAVVDVDTAAEILASGPDTNPETLARRLASGRPR